MQRLNVCYYTYVYRTFNVVMTDAIFVIIISFLNFYLKLFFAFVQGICHPCDL